jgi:hypothetical protein
MVTLWRHCAAAAVLFLLAGSLTAADSKAYTDPDKADADFAYQGEFEAKVKTEQGEGTVGLQLIALGGGKFHAVGYMGGLPGAGWNKDDKHEADGELKGDEVVVKSGHGEARFTKDTVKMIAPDGSEIGIGKKVHRKSPTLGAKPPEGAIVLFDGTSTDEFEGGRMSDDKLLLAGAKSKKTFGSQKIHVEFLVPYQPEARGQGRGNSGLYLQGRYEVQMLDSFGLKGENNECGGLYSVKAPDLNMCLPPLVWQTYDVDYTAAKYSAEGKLLENPRVTVEHNGVVIHKDVELPGERNTTAAPTAAGPEKGPLYLQDHGNPVRYRNIWVVEI